MRIYAPRDDRALSRVNLLLTVSEAGELRDSLNQLLAMAPEHTHHHIGSGEEGVDLEVELYGPGVDIHPSPRLERLIEENE